MNAGELHVFHDRADHRHFAVGNAIDIDFDRVFQESIDQHRPIRADLDRRLHVTREIFVTVNQFHRAPAENETMA